MIILLGTTSKDKRAYLENNLGIFFGKEEITLFPKSVNSDISEQPLNEDEVIQGSINRARNAIKDHNGNFDFAVGMEGGLVLIKEKLYHLVCSVSIVDSKGNEFIGISHKTPLPQIVSEAILNGREFGEEIRAFSNHSQEPIESAIGSLVSELISREQSFNQAIISALIQCKNYKFFIKGTN